MPSLLKPDDRDAILVRLSRLTPEHRARWGSLTAPAMLCHLGDQLAVALGDIPVIRHDTALTRFLGKYVVIRTPMKPPPNRARTAPEMMITRPSDWPSDMARCRDLAARASAGRLPGIHPLFGPLTPGDWGVLCWKHMDHHLRQFGE